MKKLLIILTALLLCGCAGEYTPEITEIVFSSEVGSYSSRPVEVTFTLPPEMPAQTCSPSAPCDRSNIAVIKAEGSRHCGTYIDIYGCEYAFDFSDKDIRTDLDFIEALEELDNIQDKTPVNTYDDIDAILTMTDYADKIDTSSRITSEAYADTARETLYILRSDFTLAEIYSVGDFTNVSTDEYAQKIYSAFTQLN
ncbi:MAG: hypothetical protein ACI4JF_10270 [Oscillospiraceae bacterium]